MLCDSHITWKKLSRRSVGRVRAIDCEHPQTPSHVRQNGQLLPKEREERERRDEQKQGTVIPDAPVEAALDTDGCHGHGVQGQEDRRRVDVTLDQQRRCQSQDDPERPRVSGGGVEHERRTQRQVRASNGNTRAEGERGRNSSRTSAPKLGGTGSAVEARPELGASTTESYEPRTRRGVTASLSRLLGSRVGRRERGALAVRRDALQV